MQRLDLFLNMLQSLDRFTNDELDRYAVALEGLLDPAAMRQLEIRIEILKISRGRKEMMSGCSCPEHNGLDDEELLA